MSDLYYAIHVTAQFATIDDFGSITDGTGFFQDGVTDDAFLLLAAISGEPVVAVTSDNNVESIYQTGTLQFHATVGALGEQAADQSVTWAVTGNTSADTAIDATGLLTVGPDEPSDGVLTITATSAGEAPYTGQSGTTQVSVRQATVYEIEPGTTATVSIDGIEWYVLVKDTTDNKALLWAKGPVEKRQFNSSTSNNTWRDSSLRTYLNGDWLNGTTVLKGKVVETDITTRSQYNASTWITTQDKVFLLSEADLFGTFNKTTITTDARDYTYGNSVIVPDVNMRKVDNGVTTNTHLRSPCLSTAYVGYMMLDGTIYENANGGVTRAVGIRPALWFSLDT